MHRGDADELSACIPVAVREHLLEGRADPEHRQVTVAFIHYEGMDDMLTRHGGDLAAFALDELVTTVQDAADRNGVTFLATDVDRDGGKIILVAGAPDARGDDEERMLLTLRQIADAEPSIDIRIGVNSGPVFVGDVGPSYRRTYTVMGDAVNLAARVMSKAEPGEILATQPVLEASGVRFETEPLEPFMVKGKKHPVTAFRVGKILGSSRSDDLADLPLVGRERELDVLRETLKEAAGGRGTLLEIVGDAGIGKTRLIREVRALEPELPWHEISCEPYEASTPYFPFRVLLRALLGLPVNAGHDETVVALRDRVAAACPELLPWLPLFAVPLDLEIPDTPEVAALEERFRRERLESAVGDLLAELGEGPRVAVIEDAQWLDEASADLTRAIAARMDDVPLILVIARREPEVSEGAVPDPHRRTLELGPLAPEASVELIHIATEDAPLTSHVVDLLVSRSGGGPRFLKAMLHAVIESGGSVEELPGSVEGLVMAQIDRLPPRDRTRLRYLSVLGMSFTEELAARLLEEEGLEPGPAAWRPLEGLLIPDDRGGFRFRNGLVREVAYESLPFRTRRALHARVGATLEADAGADADEIAEVLAFHFLHSDEAAKAWHYARVAAEWAAGLFANVEARDAYLAALEAARRLADVLPHEVAAVAEALGDVEMLLGEYQGARTAYRTTRRHVPDDAVAQGRLLLKEALVNDIEGNYSNALRTLSRGRNVVEDLDQIEAARLRAQLAVHYGSTLCAQGRYEASIGWSLRALEEATTAGDKDAMAHAYYLLDVAEVSSGWTDGKFSVQALELYRELGNRTKQADVMNNLGGYAYWAGRWDEARSWYERAREVYLDTGNIVDAGFATANLGEILLAQGYLADAEKVLHEALRGFRASGVRSQVAFVQNLLAAAAARAYRFDEAETLFKEVAALAGEMGDAARITEVEALSAESLVLQGKGEDAAATAQALLGAHPSDPTTPLLLRVAGYALAQIGEREGAEALLCRALEAGHDAEHEVAFTLEAMLRVGVTDGRPRSELKAQRDALFERLGIVAVPDVPSAAIA